MICSICAGSALTRPSVGSSTVISSIVSPIRGLSIWAMFATTSLRSSTRGWSICLRLKASSCWVSDAARSAVFLTSSMSRRRGSSAVRRSRSSSVRPVMTVRRLLKSCATPPASRPTASIFWAWRSCASLWRSASSARLRSVMSSTVDWMAGSFSQRIAETWMSNQTSEPSFLTAWDSYCEGTAAAPQGSPRAGAARRARSIGDSRCR